MQAMRTTSEDQAIFPKTRDNQEAPKALVVDGKVAWGSFDKPLPNINLLDSEKPLGIAVPKRFIQLRLKAWQAFQIDSEDFFLLGALYQTGLCAFNILSVWDKKEGTLQTWQAYAPGWKLDMANNLLASENKLCTKNSELMITNRLEHGACTVLGSFNSKKKAQLQFNLKCCSEPSVMSMPLGHNRGLYTHKALLEVSGYLTVGNKVFNCNSGDLAIIDDHKGFYPYKLHYDWVTGFKRLDNDQTLAFNLTKNQVTEPKLYNENWLWVNGSKHPLPLVAFKHVSPNLWEIKDNDGFVDLELQIVKDLEIKQQFIVASANYRAVFGIFNGKLKDSTGVWHEVKQVYGMGEDKTYRL